MMNGLRTYDIKKLLSSRRGAFDPQERKRDRQKERKRKVILNPN